MKQLTYLLLFLPIFCYSQKTFAPLNTVWNYEMKSNLDPQTNECRGNHVQYRVVEELIIDGKDCSLIRAGVDSLIVFQDQDKIYFLQDSSFLLLFDFGAQLGDTIVRYDPVGGGLFSGFLSPASDTTLYEFEMVVTDVTTELVGGVDRRVLTFENTSLLMGEVIFPLKVMDGIGSVDEGFSGFFLFTLANGCDGYFACYESDSLSFQRRVINNIHPGCDFIDSVDDEFAIDVKIYPNPFTSEIHLDLELQDFQVRIVDVNGRVIIQEENQAVIDTYGLNTGLYMLQIVKNEKVYSREVVKI